MAMQNPPPTQPPTQPPSTQSSQSNERLWAALSYIFTPLVPIIVLSMQDMKEKPYPRYHAIQAIGVFVAFLILEAVASALFICGSIATLGLGACVLWLLFFLPLIPIFYYGYLAYTGKPFNIPLVTNMMVQQGWLKPL
ncbi:MAG TPA: hypothetical protein VM409_03975 [Chloroflexia bacterium]|nr:hypothetical protein [Chloroflexia bacterium]